MVSRMNNKGKLPRERHPQKFNEGIVKARKDKLMKELNEVLGQLENNLNANERTDVVLSRLRDIEDEAREMKFYDIKRLAVLGIGKRIINFEIYKKEKEFLTKQDEKDRIQKEYREHRIKKFDYNQVEMDKLKQNIVIVKPYASGKGFNAQASTCKDTHAYALHYSNYFETVRELNKIFFNDHKLEDEQKEDRYETFMNITGKVSIVLCISMIALVVWFSSYLTPDTFNLLCKVEGGLALLAIVVNFLVAVMSFRKLPEDKTELQKTFEDIVKYLDKINEEVANDTTKRYRYEWHCPKDFLYIELRFLEGFPTSALDLR